MVPARSSLQTLISPIARPATWRDRLGGFGTWLGVSCWRLGPEVLGAEPFACFLGIGERTRQRRTMKQMAFCGGRPEVWSKGAGLTELEEDSKVRELRCAPIETPGVKMHQVFMEVFAHLCLQGDSSSKLLRRADGRGEQGMWHDPRADQARVQREAPQEP